MHQLQSSELDQIYRAYDKDPELQAKVIKAVGNEENLLVDALHYS